MLAIDMNCNFYSDYKVIEQMARMLGLESEAEKWADDAAYIKKKLFERHYDEI